MAVAVKGGASSCAVLVVNLSWAHLTATAATTTILSTAVVGILVGTRTGLAAGLAFGFGHHVEDR